MGLTWPIKFLKFSSRFSLQPEANWDQKVFDFPYKKLKKNPQNFSKRSVLDILNGLEWAGDICRIATLASPPLSSLL
jgi:hypothetical protein